MSDNLFSWISAHEKIIADASVVGIGVAGLGVWATYETMARNFGYADAGTATAVACCGTPLALAVGGYGLKRALSANLQFPTLPHFQQWWQGVYTDTHDEVAPEIPDMSDWVNVVHGLSRARRPILPIGRRLSGGLVGLDFNETPHLIVNGLTGSGKTMSILRPLAASAAISGLFQVVILDKSGRNFRALEGHQNIHVVKYDHNQLPHMAKSIYAEILRRDQWLATQSGNPTTIDRARADRRPPRVLIIIDEFANASGLLKVQDRQAYGELTASLIQVAQEGRAMSVHLVLVAQRPDATQVNTTLRSQLNGLTFQMRDANDARLADAPNAENLGEGQAILSGNTYETIQTFKPSDAEIRQALGAEETRDCGEPDWLFGYGETTSHLTETRGDNGVGTPFVIRTGTPWDLGAILRATSGNGVAHYTTGDNGDSYVDALVKSLLENDEELPSPIENLSMNQYRATLLALSMGIGVGTTAEMVIGYANGRSKKIIRSVRERAGLPVAVSG